MRIPTWLGTCSTSSYATATLSTATTTTTTATSSSSSSLSCSDSSNFSIDSNLESNLSIQTLPSVLSLQKLNLELQALNPLDSFYCITSLKPDPSLPIACLAVHGNLLYAASSHLVNAYDLTTLSHVDSLNTSHPSSGAVKSIVFSNGQVLTAHQDSKIRVWEFTTPFKKHKLVTVLPTVNDRVRRFILPKNYVDVRRHKKKLWIEHADAVTSLAVNNGFIYSVSWDKTLKIWSSGYFCLESVNGHEDAVNAVVVSADGTVYTGSTDRKIRIWVKEFDQRCNNKMILNERNNNNNNKNKNNNNNKCHVVVETLEKHKSAVNALALNDDGSVLFSGSNDRSILVWEKEDSGNYRMVVRGALRGHRKGILCLVMISGCELLLSGSADRTVRIWRDCGGLRFCCLGVLDGHCKPVKSVAGVWDGEDGVVSVFSGSLDGEIKACKVHLEGFFLHE